MIDTKHISISDYNYELPDERIAKFPVTPRDSSKLLVYDNGHIADGTFRNLAGYLPAGALMVMNNTKVIQARLHFRKSSAAGGAMATPAASGEPSGALIEVFLLEPFAPADYEQIFQTRGKCTWLCMIGNLKKWKEGALTRAITIAGEDGTGEDVAGEDGKTAVTITAKRLGAHGTSHIVELQWEYTAGTTSTAPPSFAEILDAMGELPIPPYLNRKSQESDKTTYQTVYSKIKGSVAAPTAGLHFTPEVLRSLDAAGIEREELTLHVGAGTFKPVKSKEMGGHEMHTEHISVSRNTLQKLLDHQCRAIAVGTTSVRTLESLYYMGLQTSNLKPQTSNLLHVSQWEPYELPEETMHPSREAVCGAIRALLQWMDEQGMDTLQASTQIIIAPGYVFKIVDTLITNFHQPQSTLLLLVSAFTQGRWRDIYNHALASGYRFLSYGDSSLLRV